MNWQGAISTGVISGLIASGVFSMFLAMIKPKIKLSKQICLEPISGNKKVYRIKVVNMTLSMLTNLKYSLHYHEMHGDEISTVTEIEPYKKPIVSISGYSLKNTDYAIRLTYDIDSETYPLNDKSKLVFTFIADHALSGTTKCIKEEYTLNEIKEGIFETGKSVRIINPHH